MKAFTLSWEVEPPAMCSPDLRWATYSFTSFSNQWRLSEHLQLIVKLSLRRFVSLSLCFSAKAFPTKWIFVALYRTTVIKYNNKMLMRQPYKGVLWTDRLWTRKLKKCRKCRLSLPGKLVCYTRSHCSWINNNRVWRWNSPYLVSSYLPPAVLLHTLCTVV